MGYVTCAATMLVLMDALRDRLSDMLMNSLAELDWDQVLQLANPVLRLEALVHDGNTTDPHPPSLLRLKMQLVRLPIQPILTKTWTFCP